MIVNVLTDLVSATLRQTKQESRAVARKPHDAAAVLFRFKVRRQHSLQV